MGVKSTTRGLSSLPPRPSCPQHPEARVWLDGYVLARWSDAHRRPRYRCLGNGKKRGHVFSPRFSVRQPTNQHPDTGQACPHCERDYGRHDGVKTGRWFIFGQQEIARMLVRIGEGMSLRAAAKQLRESVFRHGIAHPSTTSSEAGLAAGYLDAFGASVVEQLRPRTWPKVIVVDSTALMATGYRDGPPLQEGEEPADEEPTGTLKAGTIMIALDGTLRGRPPVQIQVQGGKDTDSWRAFFGSLAGEPEWVIADLDHAIARAVRETWPRAVLFHSRHHLAQLMRKRAREDGMPGRIRLDEPIQLRRPIPWSPSRSMLKRYGDHPLMVAIAASQRGPKEWNELKTWVELMIPPERLALRSWMATNELLITRQWEIVEHHGKLPLSTGSLEGKITEWLAPIKRRAGRWQNARRLNTVLGLIMLRARGEAHVARYAAIVRAPFAARGNQSHLAWENTLPCEQTEKVKLRQMSWWRTWQDRREASLPRLVRDAERATLARQRRDQIEHHRQRLEAIYAEANDLRHQFGIPIPPRGKAKRPTTDLAGGSVAGKKVADIPILLAEWDWDANLDLDPFTLPASSKERASWRCALNPEHIWDTRISARVYDSSFCPYHMGVKVHPAESLAAYFPDLVPEWHPTRNVLHPHEVSRSSAREVLWRCRVCGHEWPTVVYQRTILGTGCPKCYRREASQRVLDGIARTRRRREQAAREQMGELGIAG